MLNRGDLTEKANKNISNSLTLILVASPCFSLLNAFSCAQKYSPMIFSMRTNDITMEIIFKIMIFTYLALIAQTSKSWAQVPLKTL